MILLAVGSCAVIGFVFVSKMSAELKSSWAFTEGVKLAQNNPQVIAKLGQPIEATWVVVGTIHTENEDSGGADVTFPITGPKGAASVHAIAEKKAGKWAFRKAEAILPGNEIIDLLAKEPEKKKGD
jgi:hypothetical protein